MEKSENLSEGFRYVFYGGISTVATWLFYSALVVVGVDLNVSNIASWVFGVLFAFVLNKWLVFHCKSRSLKVITKEFTTFIGSRVFTGAIAIILFPILLEIGFDQSILGVDGAVSKFITSVIEIVLNWVFSKYWVFKKE